MEAPALKAAVELTLMPSRVRVLRESPLPDGVALLLRIAAGDLAAEKEASASLERSVTMVREASAFFIEQMMTAGIYVSMPGTFPASGNPQIFPAFRFSTMR